MKKYLILLFLWFFWCLSPALAAEPDSPSLTRGLQFYNAGKFEDALSEFLKIIQSHPTNIEAHYFRGLTFQKTENFAQAVASFKKVLELDSGYSGARRNLGISYFKLESYDPALRELEQSLEKEPGDASTHFFLGLTLQQQEKYEESLIHFQTALSLDPDLAQIALFQIGLAYLKMDQKEDAQFALTRAVEEDPDSETAREAQSLLGANGGGAAGAEKPWWIKAGVSWQYDDNVSVTEQDIVTNRTDMAAVFEFSGGYRVYSTDDLKLVLGYDFYQNAWEDMAEFNFQSHTLSFGGSHAGATWDSGIDYYYSYSVLNEEEFLESHSAAPRLGFSTLPQLYTHISPVFQAKKFFDNGPRDATNVSLGLDQYLFLMENKAFGFLSYRYYDEDARGSEFDYAGSLISTGVHLPGPFKSKILLSYTYTLLDYKNDEPTIGVQRRDEKQTVRINLTQPVWGFMNFNLDYQYNVNSSNLVSVDSRQNLLTLKLEFSL